MPKRKYALERGGDKLLDISWKGNWKNTEVRLKGNLRGTILNKKELRSGQIFQLPDGTDLRIQLVKSELRVLRNDKPLPGSGSDPAAKLAQSFGIIYFISLLNIVLGFIALFSQVEFLQTLGFGIITVAIGLVFLMLGFFTQRRSLIALIIALIIYSLDTVPILFRLFNIVLEPSNGFNNDFLLISDILQRIAPGIGWVIMRIGFLVGMGQGIGAINELKIETSPTVS